MINWDLQAQTVLSNEEVIYGEENARLFKAKVYVLEDDNSLSISPSRLKGTETIIRCCCGSSPG